MVSRQPAYIRSIALEEMLDDVESLSPKIWVTETEMIG